MNIQAYLTATDSITVNRITFDYSDSLGYLPAGTAIINPFCPDKNPTQLQMSIDLAQLTQVFGFNLNVNGIFTGEFIGENTVIWSIAQDINTYVSKYQITVEKITGQFTTLVSQLTPPSQHAGCDGVERSYVVQLDTTGTQNELTISVHGPLGISDTVHAKNFTFQATAGQFTDITVRVVAKQNRCGTLLVEGQPATLLALVTGVPEGTGITYQWNVQGMKRPHLNSSSVSITLPEGGTPVTVSVTVTDASTNTVTESPTVTLPILTPAEAARTNSACRLASDIQDIYFRRPPYNPGDLFTYEQGMPVSQQDMRAFASIANGLIAAGERFNRSFSEINSTKA
jgi:hypothetical protein